MERIASVAGGTAAIHLAIMHEPFFKYVIEGRKTVESRFSTHRIAPYGYVERGDLVLLKKIGGAVSAITIVDRVVQFRLDERSWATIYEQYASDICATAEFFQEKRSASYATLMRLTGVSMMDPVSVLKRDRQGWAVLIDRHAQLALL